MKRLLNTLLLMCLAVTAMAQQKPVYERTRTDQVLSDRATWSRALMALPHGATPTIPSYVSTDYNGFAMISHNGGGATTDRVAYGSLDNVAQFLEKDTALVNTYANKDSVHKYYQYSLNRQVAVDSTQAYEIFDNSYGTVGTIFNQYKNIIKNTLGIQTLVNNASGGTGIIYAQRRQMLNSPQVNNNRLTTLNGIYNIIGQQGNTAKTYNMIYYGYKAFIANKFLATAIPASNASISTTGTWSTYTGSDSSAMKATYISGTAKQTFTSGATMTATVTGPRVVIGVSVGEGTRIKLDTMAISIDGVFMAKFCGNNLINYAPQLDTGVPVNTFLNYYHQATVLTFNNIGPGAHTVVITKGSDVTARIVIDYIGTLVSPSTASPLVLADCPYFNPVGMTTYHTLYGSNFSNGAVDTANLVMRNVVREFQDLPIAEALVNTTFNALTDVGTDGIHPTEIGLHNIAKAYLATMTSTRKVNLSTGTYLRSDNKYVVGSQIPGATSSAKMYNLLFPAGGQYNSITGSGTGAIKITVPSNGATMTIITGWIYNHTNRQTAPFFISYYGSTLTNGVAAQFYKSTGYTVRFYTNGTTPNIYIGELASIWNFLKVSIDKVLVAHSGSSDLTYASGWSVGLEPTAFTGTLATTLTAAQTQPYATLTGVETLTNKTLTTPIFTTYTVATLPTGLTVGSQANVTDAVAPTYLGTLTGGGTVFTPVILSPTGWVSH